MLVYRQKNEEEKTILLVMEARGLFSPVVVLRVTRKERKSDVRFFIEDFSPREKNTECFVHTLQRKQRAIDHAIRTYRERMNRSIFFSLCLDRFFPFVSYRDSSLVTLSTEDQRGETTNQIEWAASFQHCLSVRFLTKPIGYRLLYDHLN